MKVEISNKDFVTYLVLLVFLIAIIVMWMKVDNVRLENQVKINTQSIMNIDAYLQQQLQRQQQARPPQLKLAPPKKKDKE